MFFLPRCTNHVSNGKIASSNTVASDSHCWCFTPARAYSRTLPASSSERRPTASDAYVGRFRSGTMSLSLCPPGGTAPS